MNNIFHITIIVSYIIISIIIINIRIIANYKFTKMFSNLASEIGEFLKTHPHITL